jgi:RNA polymerase sigma factor (TIGR02999 family)
MTSDPRTEVTLILQELARGGRQRDAPERLFPLVYGELRVLAGAYLRRERPGHTLQATEVVNEAYLKLVGQADVDWQGRGHFFGVAARAMRQILVDHARKRSRDKRGGGEQYVTLHEAIMGPARGPQCTLADLIALNDALAELAALDERQARIVELRCFTGLKVDEVAEVLGVSRRTVEGGWTHARAWLKRRLSAGEPA